MSLTIERIVDVEGVLAVLSAFDHAFPRSISGRVGSLRDHARKLAERAVFAVARQDGDVVGFTAFYANDASTGRSFLSHLAIVEECRGQGIGMKLMRWSMDEARQAGMTSMILEVDTDNRGAISFYQSLGFVLSAAASPVSRHMVLERL